MVLYIILFFADLSKCGLVARLFAHPFEDAIVIAGVFFDIIFWFVEVFDAGWSFWHGGSRAGDLAVVVVDFASVVFDADAGTGADGVDVWVGS